MECEIDFKTEISMEEHIQSVHVQNKRYREGEKKPLSDVEQEKKIAHGNKKKLYKLYR